MKSQCQIKGCNNPAQWALYRTNPDGEKLWLYVCRYHERIIGDENMGEVAHFRQFFLTKEEAGSGVADRATVGKY